MHWKKIVKPDAPYFGEQDFDSIDQIFLVTITELRSEQVRTDRGTEIHGVLHFAEDVKPLILNITNGKKIAELYGKMCENWSGKQIALYFDPNVRFGGQRVGGVRVADPKKKKPKAEKCSVCGHEIAAFGRMSGQEMAAYTASKYGAPMCAECATKAAETKTETEVKTLES